ncbi:D-arabinono-1,4-lactone oxidase [Nocardiopsis changdeensis]|uniref:FAD-binding protein n=1 Tax=Nocardiopsis changdeensis TaxID=2831969 RepID=A0ABX8BJK7_9ACTN|nr:MULTISPECIES: D-arabinono-1,4-lactone oxidase [Nocardiopsis]QUX22430.1 FAD-binding protein [Nocardiopsis changdeensis]QYX38372.1 FAD-binding protein [Nocardiopsis sp. MT53]
MSTPPVPPTPPAPSTPPAPVRNWAGNLTYASSRIHRPADPDALRALVRDTPRIRALGSGHSFNRVADSDHDLVCLDGLPREIDVDPGAATVTVSAGTRYAELAAELHRQGFALANLASLPHISVAGSCATGTHGSGDRLRCLAAAVRGLELLGPGGETVRLGRETDPEVFPGAVVALGALGVVTRLTLEVEPAFEVSQRVRLDVPLAEAAADFDAVFGAAYSVSLFTDWSGGVGRVWLKHRVGDPEGSWAGGRPADTPQHPVPGMPAGPATEQLGAVGPWSERLPHFRSGFAPSAGEELQSEFYLPRAAAAEGFAALRGLGERIAPVLHISEVRTVRADDLWLSPAYGRDSVAFHFTWRRMPEAVAPVLAAVEERLAPLGARPHWGKLSTLSPADVAASYERAADFAGLLERFDPEGKFRNAFTDAYFPRS